MGPAKVRSRPAIIEGMASAASLPRPTSSKVPIMMRTILYKNPSADILKYNQEFCSTSWQWVSSGKGLYRASAGAKLRKSWVPTKVRRPLHGRQVQFIGTWRHSAGEKHPVPDDGLWYRDSFAQGRVLGMLEGTSSAARMWISCGRTLFKAAGKLAWNGTLRFKMGHLSAGMNPGISTTGSITLTGARLNGSGLFNGTLNGP